MEEISFGIEPEIVKEFEGKWIYMKKEGSSYVILAFLKKAGHNSGLFMSPTKHNEFAVLYDSIISIGTHSGKLTMPDGRMKEVVNGVLVDDVVEKVVANGV